MNVNLYVDGFNLYYGSLKDTRYRWLDLAKLLSILFPSYRINRIRYFTAQLLPSTQNPGQHQRQQTYLRALRTIPDLSIHYGFFVRRNITMPLAFPESEGRETAFVTRIEEKGTDVNLASYLLLDAFDEDFEVAAIVSNDSDLVTSIELVRQRFGLTVGVLNPHRSRNQTLANAASFYRPIRSGPLSASQFPDRMQDAAGTFTKPNGW